MYVNVICQQPEEDEVRCNHRGTLIAVNGEVVGVIELQPTICWPEAKEVIHTLQARGLETVIISGDNETPTQQLATRSTTALI